MPTASASFGELLSLRPISPESFCKSEVLARVETSYLVIQTTLLVFGFDFDVFQLMGECMKDCLHCQRGTMMDRKVMTLRVSGVQSVPVCTL